MHQFDLLYIPHDRLYGNTYKYILTGIDVASRYKVARPLRTKKACEVVEMIKDIYKAGILRYPKIFQCDNGSEFKSNVTRLLEDKSVEIKRVTTKYHHTYTAFVESYNKVVAERLFKPHGCTRSGLWGA
ncbi:KRAB-A domain-containing protein 2-like [Hydractinia symbiolongicarpus]|uniref:KRAB-A domain-containing protein 2-like n=1 Tax=Hydractinia symbiolongicarpus TaxID=13093 RepID=UPI00254D6F8C|nr:KRAB-A domain-containing protein 2-like [Hydractinia symbiolongicarpus]